VAKNWFFTENHGTFDWRQNNGPDSYPDTKEHGMHRSEFFTLAFMLVALSLGGCGRAKAKPSMPHPAMEAPRSGSPVSENLSANVQSDRMLIWTGSLTLEVSKPDDAVVHATELVKQAGGYVEETKDSGYGTIALRLRIPSAAFQATFAGLEKLGKIKLRTISGHDATEEYIDVEARLKNKAALRDSLKQLLEKASDIKDILAIEAELNRVQSDVDSMEGRLKALKAKAELAVMELIFMPTPPPPKPAPKRIYGPLGYFFKGLYWGIEKLFIIRK
jgi:hypothetical protein